MPRELRTSWISNQKAILLTRLSVRSKYPHKSLKINIPYISHKARETQRSKQEKLSGQNKRNSLIKTRETQWSKQDNDHKKRNSVVKTRETQWSKQEKLIDQNKIMIIKRETQWSNKTNWEGQTTKACTRISEEYTYT